MKTAPSLLPKSLQRVKNHPAHHHNPLQRMKIIPQLVTAHCSA